MKLFDKYFQPYAEYCIRTTFSEDELKEALAQECPATSDILSWKAIKAAIGLSKTDFKNTDSRPNFSAGTEFPPSKKARPFPE